MRVQALAGLGVAGIVAALAVAVPAGAQTPFTHRGIDAQHPASSVLPNEQVDPASGALAVVATDLVLPGNAGLNLSVTRVYNSNVYPNYSSGSTAFDEDSWAGIGWKLHFGRILSPDATGGGETQIEMGDGSRHALYHQTGGGWITTDFWTYDKATHILKLPNGLLYTFDREVFINATIGTVRYVTEIKDPYNNRLTFAYFDASGPPDGVQQIQQHLSASQIRTVTFAYDPTLKALASMTYNGRTWTYTHQAAGPSGYSVLTGVTPPIGPGGQYQYTGLTGELTRLTTPAGGYVAYTYADAVRRASTLSMTTRVVMTRTTGGPSIVAGTWTYAYGTGSNQDTTVVTCPCGTTRYRFYGTGLSGDFTGWSAGTLAEQRIEEPDGTQRELRTVFFAPSETISTDAVPGTSGVWADSVVRKALLTQTIVTRGTQSWTTTHAFHSGLGNYNDYGRPYQTTEQESAYVYRTTTRTFQYGFTPYIVDRVASEAIQVRTSYSQTTPTESSSWTYSLASGFLTAQNLFGTSTTFEPATDGNVAAVTDGRGNRTTYAYSWGVLQDVHTPGTQTTSTVTSDGLVSMVDNHTDIGITYVYDTGFRLKQVQRTGLNTLTYEYDNVNARFLRVARDQAQTESQLDGFGRVISTSNVVNLKTRVERDACGRTTFTSAPYTAGAGTRGTTVQYDALGRVTRTTSPAGDVTQAVYSGVDVTQIDGETRTTAFHYLAFGGPGTERLVSVTDATTTATTYEYDVFGNLTQVTGPRAGVTRTWVRNNRGLVTSETQPESGTTTYLYDAVGHVTQRTTADSAITTYTYDTDNRLWTVNAPGTADDLTLTYDTASRVATQVGGGTTTTFGYDTKGRLIARSDVASGLTFGSSYGYDANDNLSTLTYPSTRVVTYLYDIEHRLTTVKNNGVNFAQTFTYGDNGQLASYVTGAVTHTFTPDTADRVSRIVASSAGGTLDLTYTYDHVGNVKTIADPRAGMSQSFDYDSLYRLATATGPWGQLQWSYDAAGNRLTETRGPTTTYVYNTTTQRLTSTSGAVAESFGYDALGRLTSDSRGTYTYNARDLLATFTSGTVASTYAYDPAGLRLAQVVNNQTTYTIRDAGGTVLSEYQGACGTPVWSRDTIYAGGRPLGAVKANLTLPSVAFVNASATIPEGQANPTVSVRLTTPGGAALACPVTVTYHAALGTATAADLTVSEGTVTFAAGSANLSTQTIALGLVNDTLDEDDETVTLNLTSVTGGTLGTPAAETLTIQDDDATPSLSINDASISEGNSGATNLNFSVSLSTMSGREVRVNYASSNGTATAGTDYQAASGTLIIPAGTSSVPLPVTVLGDLVCEPSEQFSMTLSAPVNITIADGSGLGTIVDDDPVTVGLSVNRTFPLQAGNSMTWTATASGATAPYEYQFWMYTSAIGWRVVQTYSAANTFAWTPATVDTYTVQVTVRSAGSVQSFDGWAVSAAFVITAAPSITITSFTPSVVMPVSAGTTVTWTATATGGAPPLQYKFQAFDPVNGWTVLADYGSANTVTWTPLRPGSHALQVWVRRPGSTAAYDTYAETGLFTVSTGNPVVKSLTPSSSTPVAPGTAVTWTAKAGGPDAALEYQFWLYRLSTGTWSITQAYSSASTWTWTPSVADTYAVQVWVRVPGSPNSYDAWLGSNYVVVTTGAVSSVSLTVNQTLPVAPSSPLTWTADATGGTAPLQFKFLRYDATAGTWTTVQDWSGSKTYTWTPTPASSGVTVVQVWVRSTGSGAQWDAYTTSGFFLIIP